MLKHTRIQRYKSLVDVSVDLEPLTVFIGPNGSGKSSYCEALEFFSSALKKGGFFQIEENAGNQEMSIDYQRATKIVGTAKAASKFSVGQTSKPLNLYFDGTLSKSSVIYDFVPISIINM